MSGQSFLLVGLAAALLFSSPQGVAAGPRILFAETGVQTHTPTHSTDSGEFVANQGLSQSFTSLEQDFM